MGEKIPVVIRYRAQSLTSRLEKIRDIQQRQLTRKIPSRLIANALIEEGYLSLDAQAKARPLKFQDGAMHFGESQYASIGSRDY